MRQMPLWHLLCNREGQQSPHRAGRRRHLIGTPAGCGADQACCVLAGPGADREHGGSRAVRSAKLLSCARAGRGRPREVERRPYAYKGESMYVKDIMQTAVTAVPPDARVSTAYQMMTM